MRLVSIQFPDDETAQAFVSWLQNAGLDNYRSIMWTYDPSLGVEQFEPSEKHPWHLLGVGRLYEDTTNE